MISEETAKEIAKIDKDIYTLMRDKTVKLRSMLLIGIASLPPLFVSGIQIIYSSYFQCSNIEYYIIAALICVFISFYCLSTVYRSL